MQTRNLTYQRILQLKRGQVERYQSWISSLRAFAPLFTLLYICLLNFTLFHGHDNSLVQINSGKSVVHATENSRIAFANVEVVSHNDCPLCDFIAEPIVVQDSPDLSALSPVLEPVIAPAERVCPFVPYRFCDRSTSRAPPIV